MEKIYIVCENYTNAFFGLFNTKRQAKQAKRKIGGYILEYDLSNIKYDEYNVKLAYVQSRKQ